MTEAALEGDLRHFEAGEVLQLLQLAAATGRVEFARAGERAELYFEAGRPVHARTSAGSVRVGEVLVHRGAISAGALERALAAQRFEPAERLGALLVAAGAADRDQVAGAVDEVLRRIVFGLLLWREGRFRFSPGARAERVAIRPDLDLDRLILEGLSQADRARSGG